VTDINECAVINGGCEHDCFNTPGSFTCSCPPGYQLTADGLHCRGKTLQTYLPWPPLPLPVYDFFSNTGASGQQNRRNKQLYFRGMCSYKPYQLLS